MLVSNKVCFCLENWGHIWKLFSAVFLCNKYYKSYYLPRYQSGKWKIRPKAYLTLLIFIKYVDLIM